MSKSIFKSVGAVFAGLLVIIVLSSVVDAILEGTGVLPKETLPKNGSELLVVGVLVYRAAFSLLGCYVAAWLAPNRPRKHALALGVVGTLFSALGSVAMRDAQPLWYGVVLTMLSLPIAWLAGRLYKPTANK